ncbi:AAA family ATPase [Porphyromonas sp. COT-290 OH860]|uniref:AAA family ATPase n=1 Tax=Porphyromonas sp. COT-290 OH860 TaxID=1515615 RepID=UPI0006937F9D|nr:AAA family ATPase [Porphyromonas sp. COT-290 OH860]
MPKRRDKELVNNRHQVIENIQTLYLYLEGDNQEDAAYARGLLQKGQWFVMELIEGKPYFGPSRFVGYWSNDRTRHDTDRGDGRETNSILKQLYKECEVDSEEHEALLRLCIKTIKTYGIEKIKSNARFLIDYTIDLNNIYELLDMANNAQASMPTNSINEFADLLKNNHNLILSGAPGTGKTYLARQMAETLIAERLRPSLEDSEIEAIIPHSTAIDIPSAQNRTEYTVRRNTSSKSLEVKGNNIQSVRTSYNSIKKAYQKKVWEVPPQKWQDPTAAAIAKYIYRQLILQKSKEQVGFVQFHPSFDYTDFIEGLRPTTEDGKVVFERQNGIFKEFCRKALINSRNAEKSQEELYREAYIDQFIEEELDRLQDLGEKAGLKTHSSGNPFSVVEHNNHTIKVHIPNNPITSTICCRKSELKALLTTEGLEMKKVKDITLFFNRGGNSQSDSYLFSLFKHFMGQEHAYRQGYKEEKKPREELKTFVFIIDEINRGELSKIFGELFYAIDPGYRGEKGKVQTQYQNMVDDEFADGFYIPQNVYIIGTMNDIDRSIESMDFAIRRRFAFRAITAEERICMLDETREIANIVEEAKARMRRLNKEISQTPDLSSAYHIGAAYFKKLAHYYTGGNAEQAFEQLWQYHLQGILYEYLRSMPHAEASMQKLQEAYGYTHKDEHQGDDQAKGQ